MIHPNARDLYEIKRKEASEAGKILHEWRLIEPYLRRRRDVEEGGQSSFDLDDPEPLC
jgi:hypothetical protein|tara:strand:+ start:1803 stop:1976 length:174 start_codon:yes stop_codon:yes gene_type:complete